MIHAPVGLPVQIDQAIAPIRKAAKSKGYQLIKSYRAPVWEVRQGDHYALIEWNVDDSRLALKGGNNEPIMGWVRSLLSNP